MQVAAPVPIPPRRPGFTLVELMIVIAIIAVIAAIAIPNLLASKTAANESAAIGSLKTFATAQFQYHKKHDVFAGSARQLQNYNLIAGDFLHAFTNHHDNGDALLSPKAGYCFWVLHGDPSGDTAWILDTTTAPDYDLTTFAATGRASEPYHTGENQFYISEDGTMYRHAEPQQTDPNYKQFLLESMPNRPPSTWTAAH